MLTEEGYYNAWLAYCLAGFAVLCMLAWYIRHLDLEVRIMLLFVFVGLIFSPARPAAEAASWAPAIVVALFSLLAEDRFGTAAGIRSLLSGQALVIALGFLVCLLRRRRIAQGSWW